MKDIRIGHGYDVHRLVTGRALILGGVSIPYEKGLLGHSDADVLAHAVSDSILGALALGDIGKLFPDSDPAFLNADSMLLLKRVAIIAKEVGYGVGNIDSTIVAQQPKLSAYIDAMRKNIAQAVCCEIERVSVKATTEEQLGFTGEGFGICAHSVCLMQQF